MIRLAVILALVAYSHRAAAQACTTSATALTFGVYSPLTASPTDITARVTVSCNAVLAVSVSYTIQLSAGTGGGFNARRLSGPSTSLGYQLYTDPAHSSVWGDGTAGSAIVSDGYGLPALGSASRNYTVYGSMPARQTVTPGAYVDIISVIVTY